MTSRCHTGETYGAIKVVSQHRFKEHRRLNYDIKWSCCGRDEVMSQSKLNARRGQMPGQCIECRRAGKPITTSVRDRIPAGQRAKHTDWIQTPWGELQAIDGWSQEARVSRPWAFE